MTKFYLDWDQEDEGIELLDIIKEHMEKNQGEYIDSEITIGNWGEAYDTDCSKIVDYIIENKEKFKNLKKVYIGDMDYEECEVSWIQQCDLGIIANELPIESLIAKGSEGLRFENLKSENLKELKVICGGLGEETLKDIINADIPNLEKLELYLGVEDYGGIVESQIDILDELMKKANFENIKYLGLKNSEYTDLICEKIVNSDILEQIEVLDLSLGTITSKGAEVILNNAEKFSNLKKIDLSYHYMSEEIVEKLTAEFESRNIEIIVEDQQEEDCYDDEVYRYPFMTE